jgi:hypothetical protein
MPQNLSPELIQLLVEQQMAKEPPKGFQATPLSDVLAQFPAQTKAGPMSSDHATLLGGGLDAASTALMLQRGKVEDNPMYQGLHNNPLAVGGSVMAQALGEILIAHLLKNKVPQSVADSLQGNLGAAHLGYGALNLSNNDLKDKPTMTEYPNVLSRNITR